MTKRENNQAIINVKVAFIAVAMFLDMCFVGAINASAKSVKINDVSIPKHGSKYSKSFKVDRRSTFTVKVRLKTNTILGYGGNSKFKVQLMKGNMY